MLNIRELSLLQTFLSKYTLSALLFVGLVVSYNKVLADESTSVFGLSLGMSYEDGIKVLKEREMFNHIALGNEVVGKNYKKCNHIFSSTSIQKACKNANFTPTKLSKDAPKSEWEISEIEYTQGLKPPIDETTLLKNLEKRFGKLTLVHEAGEEDVRRRYFNIQTNARYEAEDLHKGGLFFKDFIEKMLKKDCREKVKVAELNTLNKYSDTYIFEIRLYDFTRKCQQRAAIDAYKKKVEQREVDRQLKLD